MGEPTPRRRLYLLDWLTNKLGIRLTTATTTIPLTVILSWVFQSQAFIMLARSGPFAEISWAQFANKSVATSTPELTYVTSDGSAIIRVDNSSTVQYNYKRDTVKITSTDSYPVGSIWVLDAVHLPYGCSVWPAFWSYGAGATWPEDGEIDVIEGVNMGFSNQMALHTEDG